MVSLLVREMLHDPAWREEIMETTYWARVTSRWSLLDEAFGPGLNRRQRRLAERRMLREGLTDLGARAWGGLKGLAATAGKKVVDAAAWAGRRATQIGGKAGELLKKAGADLANVVLYAIKQLPGGDAVLEFLATVAGKLKEKIGEMRDAIGKKVEEWVRGAKKRLVDLFFKYVLTDDEMKAHFYEAMGITEKELESIKKEGKRRGLATITELNAHFANRPWLLEAVDESSPLGDISDKIKEKTGIKDATDVAKALGAIENTGPDKVNPEDLLRGKGAAVVGKLIDFWTKLVKLNPQKYHKAFYNAGFFDLFGESGWGLAAASFLGLLASAELKWNDLVRFVKSLVRGFEGGSSRPPGSNSNRAGAFLFLGNEGNEYDSSLFKTFVTGIVKGSNIEILIRALSGDPTKVPELAKRVISTIVNGAREALKKQSIASAVARAAGEDGAADDVEGEINDAVGSYVDEMLGA